MRTWPERRLASLAESPITNGLGEAAADGEEHWPRYIRTTDIASLFQLDPDRRVTLPPAVARGALVARGDVLMTAAGSLGTSYLHDTDEAACYAGYLVRFRAAKELVCSRFVAYWTQSEHHLSQLQQGAVRSTIDNFSASKFRAMRVPHPPVQDQQRVAHFLDDQAARLDAALHELSSSRLLAAERLRSHFVGLMLTEGFANDGRGVPLRRLCKDERLGAWGEEPTGLGDVAVARVADFDRLNFNVDVVPTRRHVPVHLARLRLLQPGDTLLERSGGTPDRPVGCAVTYVGSQRTATISSNFVSRLRPVASCWPRYLTLVLAAMYEARWNRAWYTQTTGIQNLDSSAYLSLRVPQRTFGEQRRLADLADCLLAERAAADRQVDHLAMLLEERKRALITACVTGEFDVATASSRAAAAALAGIG